MYLPEVMHGGCKEAFRLFSLKNVLVLSPFFPPVKPEKGGGVSHVPQAGFELAN